MRIFLILFLALSSCSTTKDSANLIQPSGDDPYEIRAFIANGIVSLSNMKVKDVDDPRIQYLNNSEHGRKLLSTYFKNNQ